MADVNGKFITLAGSLMSVYPEALAGADKQLQQAVQLRWDQLPPEDWFSTKLLDAFMTTYAAASPTGDRAIVTLGRRVYPTIKKSVGLPPQLKGALDYIKFEAEGFLANHRGADVKPRTFVSIAEREVVVDAPAPGYRSLLYVGVYQGLLELAGEPKGNVEQQLAQERGDPTSRFRITW